MSNGTDLYTNCTFFLFFKANNLTVEYTPKLPAYFLKNHLHFVLFLEQSMLGVLAKALTDLR